MINSMFLDINIPLINNLVSMPIMPNFNSMPHNFLDYKLNNSMKQNNLIPYNSINNQMINLHNIPQISSSQNYLNFNSGNFLFVMYEF